MIDIANAAYEDLKHARQQIDERIAKLEADMVKELEEKAAHFGMMLTAKNGMAMNVKYRDGNDSWSGKGRKPTWLLSKLNEGHQLDDFRVS